MPPPNRSTPHQTIISFPVQTLVWSQRGVGASVPDVGVQLSVTGSYRPPVLSEPNADPPHTTITLPVQTAVGTQRGAGAFAVDVGVQRSVTGSLWPTVFSHAQR